MIITYELRNWASIQVHEIVSPMSGRAERELLAIADRIDAAVGGMVELPKDADGVPIHVGDTIEIDHNGRVTQVDCITCWEENWMVCCSEGGMFDPKNTRCHHVQPDSWQRIIEDAIDTAFEGVDDESEFDLKKMELVDRCRRLAGAE